MTKKVFAAMAVVAAMFAGYSAYNAQDESDLNNYALANVEALANNENNPDREDCMPGGIECSMVVIYPNGVYGEEIVFGMQKVPGWV